LCLARYFLRSITKYATANNPTTPYTASKPGKPRNPPLAVAEAVAVPVVAVVVAFAVAILVAFAVAILVAFAVAILVAFAVAVLVCVCAKAILDAPTIERITAVATTAEKSFLLTIFHLQYRPAFVANMLSHAQ
jgi:hypothetical protein